MSAFITGGLEISELERALRIVILCLFKKEKKKKNSNNLNVYSSSFGVGGIVLKIEI
jgi:hypothetical protein